jgi:deoxyadenosine/deoxycytidine kinase
MPDLPHNARSHQQKVAVVGPCASGKSTLVRSLREHGYDAYAVAQEHSAVPGLWNHQKPDVLIGLKTQLSTIRQRRGESWSQGIYESQLERLQEAYASADLIIDTDTFSESDALDRALALLGHRSRPAAT